MQQGENCVNTSVFARPKIKNTVVNTVVFATKGKNIVNTVVFGFRNAKIIGISPRVSRIRENTAYMTIFRVDKNGTISSAATCNNNKKKEKKKKNNTKKKKKTKF